MLLFLAIGPATMDALHHTGLLINMDTGTLVTQGQTFGDVLADRAHDTDQLTVVGATSRFATCALLCAALALWAGVGASACMCGVLGAFIALTDKWGGWSSAGHMATIGVALSNRMLRVRAHHGASNYTHSGARMEAPTFSPLQVAKSTKKIQASVDLLRFMAQMVNVDAPLLKSSYEPSSLISLIERSRYLYANVENIGEYEYDVDDVGDDDDVGEYDDDDDGDDDDDDDGDACDACVLPHDAASIIARITKDDHPTELQFTKNYGLLVAYLKDNGGEYPLWSPPEHTMPLAMWVITQRRARHPTSKKDRTLTTTASRSARLELLPRWQEEEVAWIGRKSPENQELVRPGAAGVWKSIEWYEEDEWVALSSYALLTAWLRARETYLRGREIYILAAVIKSVINPTPDGSEVQTLPLFYYFTLNHGQLYYFAGQSGVRCSNKAELSSR